MCTIIYLIRKCSFFLSSNLISFTTPYMSKQAKLRGKCFMLHDKDQQIASFQRKAPSLSYRALHPGDNKQNVPLALAIFHRSTVTGIADYFPDNNGAADFLNLINIWWTVNNSKLRYNSNYRLGNAAIWETRNPIF